jgi:hypothetical protein
MTIAIFLKGGAMHRRVVLMGLLFLLTGVVLVGLSGTAFGAQEVDTSKALKADGTVSNKKVNKAKTIRKDPSKMRMPEDPSETRMPEGPSEMRMPEYSIRVQVNGDRRLEGRKVIMKLRKGGRSTTRTVSLNSSGDADHRFILGSVAVSVEGNWTVTVEQGPEDSSNYYSTANICFRGTDPANHSVTLDRSHRSATVAFTIEYVIAWDREGICW